MRIIRVDERLSNHFSWKKIWEHDRNSAEFRILYPEFRKTDFQIFHSW